MELTTVLQTLRTLSRAHQEVQRPGDWRTWTNSEPTTVLRALWTVFSPLRFSENWKLFSPLRFSERWKLVDSCELNHQLFSVRFGHSSVHADVWWPEGSWPASELHAECSEWPSGWQMAWLCLCLCTAEGGSYFPLGIFFC